MAGTRLSLIQHDMFATLDTVLKYGRQNKHSKGTDFPCRLYMQRIRNNNDWFVLTCGGGSCMKGVVQEGGEMWCTGCENPVLFPKASFRVELEVSDSTATVIVVLFDETACMLTHNTAGSILAAESGLSACYTPSSVPSEGLFTPILVDNPNGTKSSIPTCLQSLVGHTWNFVLPSQSYYNHGEYETFNCKDVLIDYCDPPAIGCFTPTPPSNIKVSYGN